MSSTLFSLSGSFLSAILLILSFPPYNLNLLIWIAVVPLLVAISGQSAKAGFLLALICLTITFAVVFSYVLMIHGYRPMHHILLSVYLGLVGSVFGWAYGFIWTRLGGIFSLYSAPFIWTFLEYLRLNFGFLAFPWGMLAHTQYEVLPLIQMASIAGVYGVSFLILMVNTSISGIILVFLNKADLGPLRLNHKPQPKGTLIFVVVSTIFLTASIFYGNREIASKTNGKPVKLSIVQGNIRQIDKWNPNYAAKIMKIYNDLTMEASKERPELIIWPETATPKSITIDKSTRAQVNKIAKGAGTNLLIGSSEHQKFRAKNDKGLKFYNSAFLIDSSNMNRHQRYEKIRLFPFGEYLPFTNTIPWSFINVPEVNNFVPGKKFTVFECPDFRFGVTICWEVLFPDTVRSFVKNGAQFIINISNEAWFGENVGPYHMVMASVFRAVENQVYVVRCANTGVSCFIDPNGRIVERVKDAFGKDIFVKGILTETVIPQDTSTIYMRYGDLLIWICFGVLVVMLGVAGYRQFAGFDKTV